LRSSGLSSSRETGLAISRPRFSHQYYYCNLFVVHDTSEQNGGNLAQITLTGAITEFPTGSNGESQAITAGPDGALWFAYAGQGEIGRMTTAGAVSVYTPAICAVNICEPPGGIATGPDGALWFYMPVIPAAGLGSAPATVYIGRITTAGVVTNMYPLPTPDPYAVPFGKIISGPDGALWFTEPYQVVNTIGRITTSGTITEYSPGNITNPYGYGSNDQGIAVGPDGKIWYAFIYDSIVGKISAPGGEAQVSVSAFDFGSVGVDASSSPLTVTVTNNGASTLTFAGTPIGIGGAGASAFRIPAGGTCSATLAAGSQCQFQVVFDPTSDTGYSGAPTGLSGTTVAAGADSQGRMVVFAASGLKLTYVYETNTPGARWSTPASITVPQPSEAKSIDSLVAQVIGGSLFIAAITAYTSGTETASSVSYCQWQTGVTTGLQTIPMSTDPASYVWLGASTASAAFASVSSDNLAIYTLSTSSVCNTFLAFAQLSAFPVSCVSVAASADNAGNSEIFAVISNGRMWYMTLKGNSLVEVIELNSADAFSQVFAVQDASQNAELFLVSSSNQLFHLETLSTSFSGFTDPALIADGVTVMAVSLADSGAVDLFVTSVAPGAPLVHMFEDEDSGNWNSIPLQVATDGSVEEIISYSSDVTAYDTAGALLVNSPAAIRASAETQIMVNGAVYSIGPQSSANISTNSAGMISVCQETDSLAIPSLYIDIQAIGQTLVVEQSAGVQSSLAATTGADLMNAQDAEGNYLLQEQFRNTGTTDSLAQAFNECMNLAGTSGDEAAGSLFLSGGGKKPGVYGVAPGTRPAPRRISPNASAEPCWMISFDGPAVRYTKLSPEQAAANIAQRSATSLDSSSSLSWLGDIGDLVSGVVNSIISIVDTIVTQGADAVNAVFTFIADGVQYVFNAVVETISQAFDIVESYFAQVQVGFEKIFEWLGFVFNWGDILRTKEAFSYTLTQFLGFIQGAVTGIQGLIDAGIGNLKTIDDGFFQTAIQQAGSVSVGGYEQSNYQDSPEFTSAVSNNIFANGVIDNFAGAVGGPIASVQSDALSSFITQLTDFAATTQKTPAFTQAVAYFQTMGSSPDQIYKSLYSGLLSVAQAMLDAVLSGVQSLVDSLFGLVQTLLQEFTNVLNQTWDIPFVSQLYSYITNGATLTTIDLISLIIAIPATILYTTLNNAAPFPDEGSVTAFENSFSAQSMVSASGLGGAQPKNALTASSGGMLSPLGANLTALGGFIAGVEFCPLSGLLDVIPLDSPPFLSTVVWVLEAAGQALSFPWFTSSGAPDCTTADGTAKTLWTYEVVGVLLDAGFVASEGRIPENWNDAGVVVTFVYGVCHLAVAIIAAVPATAMAGAADILAVIPELGKLMRFSTIVEYTVGLSLVACSAIDVLFGTASASLGYFEAFPPADNSLAQAQPA
jgi:hypothetical protein